MFERTHSAEPKLVVWQRFSVKCGFPVLVLRARSAFSTVLNRSRFLIVYVFSTAKDSVEI